LLLKNMFHYIILLLIIFSINLNSCNVNPILNDNSIIYLKIPSIKIKLIKNKLGQKLYNHLIPLIKQKDVSLKPIYELHISIKSKIKNNISLVTSKTIANVYLINLKKQKNIWFKKFTIYNNSSINQQKTVQSFTKYIINEKYKENILKNLAHNIYKQLIISLKKNL